MLNKFQNGIVNSPAIVSDDYANPPRPVQQYAELDASKVAAALTGNILTDITFATSNISADVDVQHGFSSANSITFTANRHMFVDICVDMLYVGVGNDQSVYQEIQIHVVLNGTLVRILPYYGSADPNAVGYTAAAAIHFQCPLEIAEDDTLKFQIYSYEDLDSAAIRVQLLRRYQ